jgi:hypothetical protein
MGHACIQNAVINKIKAEQKKPAVWDYGLMISIYLYDLLFYATKCQPLNKLFLQDEKDNNRGQSRHCPLRALSPKVMGLALSL